MAMKKLVSVTEVDGEGLPMLMGEKVMLFCMNWVYAGVLVGVNDAFVQLDDAKLVFDTGKPAATTFAEAEPLPSPWYVQTAAIESFGKSGR